MFGPVPLPRTFEACLRDVTSESAPVRASAFADLGRHQARVEGERSRVIACLERGILHDNESRVRVAAVLAAADLDGRAVLPALLVACEDDAPFVREMAVRTLGEAGDARAIPKLRRLLDDDRTELRYQAVTAWSRMPHETVAECMEPLFAVFRREGEHSEVRLMVLRVVDEHVEQMEPGAPVPGLEAVLSHAAAEANMRLLAGIILSKLGNPEGRNIVAECIHRRPLPGHSASEDDREAVLLAGRFRWTETMPALRRRARGIGRWLADTCATESLISLAAMGDTRALSDAAELTRKARGAARASMAMLLARARVTDAIPWLTGDAAHDTAVHDALIELQKAASNSL